MRVGRCVSKLVSERGVRKRMEMCSACVVGTLSVYGRGKKDDSVGCV